MFDPKTFDLGLLRAAVQSYYHNEGTGHDWHHIRRVRDMALRIAKVEGGNVVLIEAAALVHDIGDHKFHETPEKGEQALRFFLMRNRVDGELFRQTVDIALRVSFKGVDIPDDMPVLEGKIVQDADRLDAIGAIAVARVFTYGGAHGRPIHDPDAPLVFPKTAEEYMSKTKSSPSSFNHIFEKLVHLKDRLHTETARRIAEKRHDFMLQFAEQFKAEWDGQD
jgi:uncharacterized protein